MILSDYHCPSCAVTFEATVPSPSPDFIACLVCHRASSWVPSPVACRMPKFEVVRGKWERPERKTYLDTRELGEGQSMEEFREKRAAIWEEQRKADVMKARRE